MSVLVEVVPEIAAEANTVEVLANASSYTPAIQKMVEDLIESYLSSDTSGGSSSGSSFGAALERMAVYGFFSEDCPRCVKWVNPVTFDVEKNPAPGFTSSGKVCSRCKGRAVVSAVLDKATEVPELRTEEEINQFRIRRAEVNLVHARCPHCHGAGNVHPKPKTYLYEKFGASFPCGLCDRTGYVTPITANRSMAPQHESSCTMNEADAERNGVISRVLEHLEVNAPKQREALDLYLGIDGVYWHNRDEFGKLAGIEPSRLFSLWPATIAGKKLVSSARKLDLARAAERNVNPIFSEMNDHHVLEHEVKEDRDAPQDMRTALIKQADSAARLLWDSAQSAISVSDIATGAKLFSLAKREMKDRE
jgi:hypothetical protein